MYPANTDIEKSVLGCLLLGKESCITRLSEIDFFNSLNVLVFKAIRYLVEQKKTVDVITVSDAIKKRVENSLELLAGMTDIVSTPENVGRYIENLKEYTLRREIMRAAEKARELAMTGEYENPVDLKNNVMQSFDIQIFDREKRDNSMSCIIGMVMDDVEKRYNQKNEEKLFTGFYDLDKMTAGLHPEEMTIIAARPGVGKTAFALQLMVNIARKGNRCLFVSREMSQIQIGKRILSNIATVDGHKLRLCKALTDADFDKIGNAVSKISELPVEINDSLATVQEIRAYCRELKNDGKLDALFVDYLQLCRSMKKTASRREEVEDISRQLKEMSLEFSIPVIALSQLSRESTDAKEPDLHHLRESGSLEQDADNVIFLHVPPGTDETQDYFDIKVIIGKQRNGATGYICLRYYRRIFKLCSIK